MSWINNRRKNEKCKQKLLKASSKNFTRRKKYFSPFIIGKRIHRNLKPEQ